MKKIAVYGSLKKGMHNHSLLENDGAQFLGVEDLTVPFKMIPYSSFPALIPNAQNTTVQMEIYDVNDSVYHFVEILEGYPHFYDKATTTLSNGDSVEFYIIPDTSQRLQQQYINEPGIYNWNDYVAEHFTR